jgi:hypothetical protein
VRRRRAIGQDAGVARAWLTPVVIALAIAAFGCGSSSSLPDLRPATTPACAIVTAADAEHVMHTSVVTGTGLAPGQCSYLGTTPPPSGTIVPPVATITLQQGSASMLSRYFTDLRTGHATELKVGAATGSIKPTTVPSVGDEALWTGQFLFVRSGTWLLGVGVRNHNGGDLLQSTAPARLGVGRRPKP